MATGVQTTYLLPSGQQVTLPTTPTTWVDEVAAPAASPVAGTAVTATELANDVTAGVAWLASRPFFCGYQVATQSIAASTWTPINLDTEQIDTYQGHSDSANASRYYPPQSANISAGFHDYYLVTGSVKWTSTLTSANAGIAGTRLTGGQVIEGCKLGGASGHNIGCFTADIMEVTSLNDYIELTAFQNTAGALSTSSSAGSLSHLQTRWVGTNRWGTFALPGTPHTWASNDQITATATGASPAGGVKVPLMTELNAYLKFLYAPPVARLTSQTTAQSIASSTSAWVSIQFPTQSIDNYSGWSAGANTKYTIPRAGLWTIIGFAALDGLTSQTGYVACRLSVNGAARTIPGMSVIPTTSNIGNRVAAICTDRFAANDTIELQIQQNSGSSITISNGAGNASRLLALWEAL